MENEKRMNQIILLVLSLYVPRNPYNAKAVFIDLKEMSDAGAIYTPGMSEKLVDPNIQV